MPKKKQPGKPFKTGSPGKHPEIEPPAYPEESIISEEDPDIIPDEESDETTAYEIPPPGEAA